MADQNYSAGPAVYGPPLSPRAKLHTHEVETMSVALEAAVLTRYAPSFAADAFIESRLMPKQGFSFGTLPKSHANTDRKIIDRAFPA